ncbi:MAG: ATP-binding protein, partial [Bacteroidota bacterium]
MKLENSSVPFEEVLNQFNFLVTSKRGKPLNDSETLLVEGIWNKKTYVEMAEGSRYSANYLHRTLAPRMFSQLTKSLGKGEINKHNLRIILEQVVENDTYQLSSLRKILENKVRGDTIPDISDFYGRTNELAVLKEKISQNKNRCISILGAAGIGKSALV